MTTPYLHSLVLDLRATNNAPLEGTTGHQVHALFLDLVGRVDPALAQRLHDEPGYRPFTVSGLRGGGPGGAGGALRAGQPATIRLTLLDGGPIWQALSTRLLAAGPLALRLGAVELVLERLLATPGADAGGWAGHATWAELAATPARPYLTLEFASPTAFNLGDKRFALFPEPLLVWDSFLRVWGQYAPAPLQLDKAALRAYIPAAVLVADYTLQTTSLQYPKHLQKGFVGRCTYRVTEAGPCAAQLAALAAFGRYAGVGYKTTMGMGQVRLVAP